MTTIAALNADGEKVMVTPLDGEHPRTSVQEALAAVMAELPNIGKGDRSPEGYQYRGIEAVTKHVQPLLAKHGVVISPKAAITDIRPSPAMKDGWQDVFMSVEWTITGPDGSSLNAQTTGIGRDKSDKGANKAQTQAFKYLLLHLLCIADGKDDSDGATYEHDRVELVQITENQAKAWVLELAKGDKALAAEAWPAIKGTPWTGEALQAAFEEWVNQPADEPAEVEGAGDQSLSEAGSARVASTPAPSGQIAPESGLGEEPDSGAPTEEDADV